MLDFIFEVIVGSIFDTILVYPGAFVRWICFRGKKRYKELIISEDAGINISVSMLFICLTCLAFYLI